jgi:hypothetical protein
LLRFQQVIVDPDDDQLALGLFGHGLLSGAGTGVAANDGLLLLGLLARFTLRWRTAV